MFHVRYRTIEGEIDVANCAATVDLQTRWRWDLENYVSQESVPVYGSKEQDHIPHRNYLRLGVGEEHQSPGEEGEVLRWQEEEVGAPGPRRLVVAAAQQRLADSIDNRPHSFGTHHRRRRGQQIHSTGHTRRYSRQRPRSKQPGQWDWPRDQEIAADVAGDGRYIGPCNHPLLCLHLRRGNDLRDLRDLRDLHDLRRHGRSHRSCAVVGCP